MFYPESKKEKLTMELFRNPTAEYRGTPFWAWNKKMTREDVDNTLSELKKMGMGGAHLHCRTGMDVPYLGNEFMKLVQYANKVAKENGMLTYLYDEDRWPSGFGGGFVTENDEFRMRFLVFAPHEIKENDNIVSENINSSGRAARSNKRIFLGKYEVKLKNGYLEDYKKITKEELVSEGYKIWFAYLEISGNNAWFNNQAYVNCLDRAAISKFVEVTHEKYYKVLGEEFGKSIPSIFTDEPQFSLKTRLGYANEEKEITIPFTDDFESTFFNLYKESILEKLPELFWEQPNGRLSVVRYHYHDHICERFVTAFADTIGDWCKKHDILLVGHMMDEPTLESQTAALGEAMRSYRSFGMPGIDMLCDRRELSTAKQAQSASHQYGREGVISELYGVTNWDFDFSGHKLQGDWQAALGVTVRVHHLTWTSMAGEAKRDYPASIGYQSPWYKEYNYVEDYFSRLATVMTRGKADVKVGVIHPIESYWLYWGTEEHTAGIREEMDSNFNDLIKWMLFGLIDFDFIAESLLPKLNNIDDIQNSNEFLVGEMVYEVILVPNCRTIRRTTFNRIKKYVSLGGKVVFIGEIPSHIDAMPSNEVKEFAQRCEQVSFNSHNLCNVLEKERIIDIKNEVGKRTNNIIYQMRNDGENKWLFLAHVNKMENKDVSVAEKITITIRGKYIPTQYDAVLGEVRPCKFEHMQNNTLVYYQMYEHDSLLLNLEKTNEVYKTVKDINIENTKKHQEIYFNEMLSVELDELNVLLLDMAEYQFDEGEWNKKEELLRIDNKFRELLDYPLRMEAFAQPWVDSENLEYNHILSLRFKICSQISVDNPILALENAADVTVVVNGIQVEKQIVEYYVDRDISKIVIPPIIEGMNEIVVTIPYNSKVNIEYMYLLGEFGVTVAGSNAILTNPITKLAFGDITKQGLPFYGGNILYSAEFELEKDAEEVKIAVTQFRNPVIKIILDGKDKGYIAYSPYELSLGKMVQGIHKINILGYGNRVNTFGAIHNCNRTEEWIGPDAWRTTGTGWAYEYQLKESGILISPVITIF